MADEQVKISIIVDDQGTASIKALNTELKNTKSSASEVVNTTAAQKTASESLTQTIKGERQEHRLRAFAIREGAGAVGELSTVMVGPNGLSRAVQQGANSLFEFDFAIKAVADQLASGGGKAAAFGAALAGYAIPISIAIGGIALLASAYRDYQAKVESLAAKQRELQTLWSGTRESEYTKALNNVVDAENELLAAKTRQKEKEEQGDVIAYLGRKLGITQSIIDAEAKVANARIALANAGIDAENKAIEADASYNAQVEKNAELTFKLKQRTGQEILEFTRANNLAILKIEEEAKLKLATSEDQKRQIRAQYDAQEKAVNLQHQLDMKAANEKELEDAKTAQAGWQSLLNERALNYQNSEAEIKRITLDTNKNLAESQVTTAQERLTIDREYALQTLEIDRQMAIAKEMTERGLYADIESINRLFDARKRQIDAKYQSDYAKALQHQRDTTKQDFNAIEKQAIKMATDLDNATGMFLDTFTSGFSQAIAQGIIGTVTFGEAFVRMAEQIIEKLIEMIVEATIFNIIMGFLTGGTSLVVPKLLPTPSGPGTVMPTGWGLGAGNLSIAQMNTPTTPVTPSYNITMNISAIDAQSFTNHFNKKENMSALVSVIQRAQRYGKA